MRRLHRGELDVDVRRELWRRQASLTKSMSNAEVTRIWANFRRTRHGLAVVEALADMAGRRKRCMYCGDSHAADIEHYQPKSSEREAVFRWTNLLFICPICNREKLKKEPIVAGVRKLVDPTIESPWDSLMLDAATGLLVARFSPDGSQSQLGLETLDMIPHLNAEGVADGRHDAVRELFSAVTAFLRSRREHQDVRELCDRVRRDPFRLITWFVWREGRFIEPMRRLHDDDPVTWRVLQRISVE